MALAWLGCIKSKGCNSPCYESSMSNKHNHEVEKGQEREKKCCFKKVLSFRQMQSDEHNLTLSTNLYVIFGLLSDIYTNSYSNWRACQFPVRPLQPGVTLIWGKLAPRLKISRRTSGMDWNSCCSWRSSQVRLLTAVCFYLFFLFNIIITFSSQAAFALSEKRLRCRREITQARQREDALS